MSDPASVAVAGSATTTGLHDPWDVIVIGGGNAALVAAMTARRLVKRVLLLERAPEFMRGGNTRHTRNVRFVHNGDATYRIGAYPYEELWSDLSLVGSGPNNEKLAERTVRDSVELPSWMAAHGVRWQPPLRGTLHLSRTNRFFLGGGKALVNTYFRKAIELGVSIEYDATVESFVFDGNSCSAVVASIGGERHQISTRTVICASGGFEANFDWLGEYWGPAASNYLIRGAKYNDGLVLRALYDHGAGKAGEERGFHAVAVDARAPRFDGGIATRLDMIPFGIVVNHSARRFYDEGEELWPKRYAIWGRNIAEQEGQIAYAIWDAKVAGLFMPPMYPPAIGTSISEVAGQLGLDSATLSDTVDIYNVAATSGRPFDPSKLDGMSTSGLVPPKSNWANPIDTPPFFGIAMRTGVTFTYMGLEVNHDAYVMHSDGTPYGNVFAAGEIMSGNILSSGYLAGFGLTIGSVWGRVAGSSAAREADVRVHG